MKTKGENSSLSIYVKINLEKIDLLFPFNDYRQLLKKPVFSLSFLREGV